MIHTGDARNVLATLPTASVQCCVTSPPYYGLRDYGAAGQIGGEATPTEYLANLYDVFREVARVLRLDGTLWLNMGDSYNAYNGNRGGSASLSRAADGAGLSSKESKAKDLLGMPWRLALLLQANGWYLRSDIVWHKPNPMPESIRDRPVKSHEYIFLFSRSPRYFYDAEAIKEPLATTSAARYRYAFGGAKSEALVEADKIRPGNRTRPVGERAEPSGRNKRSVWTVPVGRYKGAHFAVFPPALVEPCILAGTSARGRCAACGACWKREVARTRTATRPGADSKVTGTNAATHGNRDPQRHVTTTQTTGWTLGCACGGEPVPCVVLDPFAGSGTVGAVCKTHGREFVGVELNPEYADMARGRE
jgi:DNA modification methylase